jgi:CDGSH-type Zn-finger protein
MSEQTEKTVIRVLQNGPCIVAGHYEIIDSEGQKIEVPTKQAALCRCGATQNPPFCDGSHSRIGFQKESHT